MSDPVSTAARELSHIRWIIESLQGVGEQLFDGQLTKESGQVLDAAVKLAEVYKQLVELAAQPPATSTPKKRGNASEDVPF